MWSSPLSPGRQRISIKQDEHKMANCSSPVLPSHLSLCFMSLIRIKIGQTELSWVMLGRTAIETWNEKRKGDCGKKKKKAFRGC